MTEAAAAPPNPDAVQRAPQRSNRDLIQQIKQLHNGLNDASLAQVAQRLGVQPLTHVPLRQQRVLRGHCAGVYAAAAAHRSCEVASVGMDNNIITWNPQRGTKLAVGQLSTFYTLALQYSPSDRLLAYGGLDCSVYAYSGGKAAQLHTHGAYVTDVGFLSDALLLSASADRSARVYDLNLNTVVQTYEQHFQDVLAVDVLGESVFATGSADGFARVFDTRAGGQVQIFSLQHRACQAVRFHPGRQQVAAAAGNSIQLFDLRSEHLLQDFQSGEEQPQRLQFSASGRLLFAACGSRVEAHDVLFGNYLGAVGAHESQVTALCLTAGGEALVSGGWDAVLRVWG